MGRAVASSASPSFESVRPHAICGSAAAAQKALSLELRAATDLARLWINQGKRAEARDVLESIYGRFSEGFDTQDLNEAKAVLAQL